jgi:hypothetical protein
VQSSIAQGDAFDPEQNSRSGCLFFLVFPDQLTFSEPVGMSARPSRLRCKAGSEHLRRRGGYPGALKLHDLTALPLYLHAHALDLFLNELDVWHARPSAMKGRH